MKLQDASVLITGANRGIGLAFAEAALARGARKVYAGARSPSSIHTPGLVSVKLDVTSDQDVAAAARICSDVTLVVNNAGIARPGGLLNPEASDAARAQFDTNVFGILRGQLDQQRRHDRLRRLQGRCVESDQWPAQ